MDLHAISASERSNSHNILESITHRWSPRSMDGSAVTKEQLEPLFEAARWAPSAYNNQPWRFYYALRDSEEFQVLFDLLVDKNQQWCENAGCLMILVSKKVFDFDGSPMPTHAFDTGSAWVSFAIEGVRRGLVVHGMAGFDYEAAADVLGLGDQYHVNCMIAIGNPSAEVENEIVTLRKTIDEIAIPFSDMSKLKRS